MWRVLCPPLRSGDCVIRREWYEGPSQADGWSKRDMADASIMIAKDGPYVVTGSVEMRDADGTSYTVSETFALCRCGGSTNKPFCDGTHSKIGFQGAEKAVADSKPA